jgi:UDP-N-acetyl-D-galactosamine dehydrogenase
MVQSLIERGKNPGDCKVLVMGITFKENVADIRNSKVVDLIRELMDYSLNVHVVDPYASPNEVAHEFKLPLLDDPSNNYDGVIVAVAHRDYQGLQKKDFEQLMNGAPILFDLKGIYEKEIEGMEVWRL